MTAKNSNSEKLCCKHQDEFLRFRVIVIVIGSIMGFATGLYLAWYLVGRHLW